VVQGWPGQKLETLSKNQLKQKGLGETQVAELLPRKCKALSSNSIPPPPKQNKTTQHNRRPNDSKGVS
jgi:hypothetical protein